MTAVFTGCIALVLVGCTQKTPVAAAPPPPPPSASIDIPHLIEDGTIGSLKRGDHPVYPEAARSNRLNGEVTAHLIIGPDGHIASVQILSATNADFQNAVTTALQSWEYEPTTWKKKPVYLDATLTVKFSLENPPMADVNIERNLNFAFDSVP